METLILLKKTSLILGAVVLGSLSTQLTMTSILSNVDDRNDTPIVERSRTSPLVIRSAGDYKINFINEKHQKDNITATDYSNIKNASQVFRFDIR